MDTSALLAASGLAIGALGVVLPFYQLLRAKRLEERDKRFQNYHKLIKELVSPEIEGGVIWHDRQMAVLFELRNYHEYFPVTRRIIIGLVEKWKRGLVTTPSLSRVIEEADFTLAFIGDIAED